MIEAQAAKAKSSKAALNVDLRQMAEEQRVVLGIHEVYGEVYHQLSFDTLLPQKQYRASHEALFHCVMARIANPKEVIPGVAFDDGGFIVSWHALPILRVSAAVYSYLNRTLVSLCP